MVDFAARVRAARRAKNMSQADLAALVGKSRAWVAWFEAGNARRLLTPEDRDALIAALDLDRHDAGSPLITMDERTLEEMLVRAAELGADRAVRRLRPAP